MLYAAAPPASAVVCLASDTFDQGFDVGVADSAWAYFAAGRYAADDGIATTSAGGLRVIAGGIHRRTGEPAFTRTIGAERSASPHVAELTALPVRPEQANGGLPAMLDRFKWLVYGSAVAGSGVPGYDAMEGHELRYTAVAGGRTYGTATHPFGGLVADPDDDLRLASVTLTAIDLESWLVFSFMLTNARIYASYERLPNGRTPGHRYAAFSSAVPVAGRTPDQLHHLALAYDRSAGTMRWLVDRREVRRVERIGRRPDRATLLLDHGGVDQEVRPRQLNFGFGMLSLLDAARRGGDGLVRLSDTPLFYFNPHAGEPLPQTFGDDWGSPQSRLWGQGAELRVRRVAISRK